MAPDLVLFNAIHDGTDQPARMSAMLSLFTQAGIVADWSVAAVHPALFAGQVVSPTPGYAQTAWSTMNAQQKAWAYANNMHVFDAAIVGANSQTVMAQRGYYASTRAVTSASWSNGVTTYSVPGSSITSGTVALGITGCLPSGYNIVGDAVPVTRIDDNTFSVPCAQNPGAFVSGGSWVSDGTHPSAAFCAAAGSLWGNQLVTGIGRGNVTHGFTADLVQDTPLNLTSGAILSAANKAAIVQTNGLYDGTSFIPVEDGYYRISLNGGAATLASNASFSIASSSPTTTIGGITNNSSGWQDMPINLSKTVYITAGAQVQLTAWVSGTGSLKQTVWWDRPVLTIESVGR